LKIIKVSRSRLTIIFSAILALGIVISITIVLSLPKEEKPVITPLSRKQASSHPTPASQVKMATYYINISQQFLVRAEEKSQNKNQTEKEKKEIIALVKNALEIITEGINRYPQDDRLFAQRAKIYQGITSFAPQSIDAALADLEQAHRLSPQNPNYPKMQSLLLVKKGDFAAAAYYAQIAYELAPSNPENLNFLGDIQARAGQIEAAISSYQKLIAFIPENKPQYQDINQKINSLNNLLAQAQPKSSLSPTHHPSPAPSIKPPISTEFLPKGQALAEQTLIIAQPNEENTLKQEEAVNLNAVSGEGIIKAGETTTIIKNRHLDEQTEVYLSPIGDIENRILFLKSKHIEGEEKFFVVGLNKPASKDVKFNWWIIK